MKQFMAWMVFGVVFSSSALAQPNESFSAVSQRYDTWSDQCTVSLAEPDSHGLITNVIHLKKTAADLFCNQVFSNPKVLRVPTCPDTPPFEDWLLFGYGDIDLGQTDIGDAIYAVRRIFGPFDRFYTVDPSCSATTSQICDFSEATLPRLKCPDLNRLWPEVGGLSTGVTVFRFPFAQTSCGFKYGMFVHVTDAGCMPARVDDGRVFLAWAVSVDGVNWAFEKEGGVPCATTTTADPRLALPIIFKEGFFNDPAQLDYNGPFWHQAGFYSDPSIPNGLGDGNYYYFTGYSQPFGGISVISYRMTPNAGHPTGRGDLQIFYNGSYVDAQNLPPSYTTPCLTSTLNPADHTRSMVPASFDIAGHQFLPPNAADIEDITIFRKANGNFDSVRIAYNPVSNFTCGIPGSCSEEEGRVALRKSLSSKHPFNWGPERDLDVCSFLPTYAAPGAGSGSWYVGLVQPPNSGVFQNVYYDASGEPTKFLGYFAAKRADNCPGSCGPQGLLSAAVDILSGPNTGEVQNFRLAKTPGDAGTLQATWNAFPGAADYRIMEGNISTLRDGVLPIWDHLRKKGGILGSATSTTLPVCSNPTNCTNKYFLVATTCAAGSELSYGAAAPGPFRTVGDGACQAVNTLGQRCPSLTCP